MAMNISCKFEKDSYNIFFIRAGCYPVDTIKPEQFQFISESSGLNFHVLICVRDVNMS